MPFMTPPILKIHKGQLWAEPTSGQILLTLGMPFVCQTFNADNHWRIKVMRENGKILPSFSVAILTRCYKLI